MTETAGCDFGRTPPFFVSLMTGAGIEPAT